MLQETHSSEDDEKIWTSEWGGRALFSHGTTAARGTCILFKKSFFCNITEIDCDTGGRYIICKIETQSGMCLTLCSVYAPNTDCPVFFQTLENKLSEYTSPKLVIGDFNLVINTSIDRYNSSYNNPRALQAMKSLIKTFNLEDTWRVRNPHQIYYSWRNRAQTQASRIDLCFMSRPLESLCENCTYAHGIESDHSSIFVSIKDKKHERGPGYWKANCSLLNKDDFIAKYRDRLQRKISQLSKLDPIIKWECIKKEMCTAYKTLSRNNADDRSIAISQLTEQISEMEDVFPLCRSDMEIYENSKLELHHLLLQKANSIIFRSKARWHEGGEKCTKYFLNLERQKSAEKTCNLLIKDDGSCAEDLDDIIAEQVKFYTKLYTSNEEIVFNCNIRDDLKLSSKSRSDLDVPLSLPELSSTVKDMAKNKAPGLDGLAIEVYIAVWDIVGAHLLEAYQKVFDDNCMYSDAMCGVLNLIPKQGRDVRYLKNLRPITLLNVDYKIIEKVIANRIQSVLPEIIHPDQSGFMKERRAALVIRKVLDMITLCKRKNLDALLICLDYMKAFDRVEFVSIKGSLEMFGFPEFITKWIGILYDNFKIQIQNSGFLSKEISITRSVHQGGCSSAFLFIILVEALAIAVREDEKIYGIQTEQMAHKINMFADDTSLFSEFDQNQLNNIMDKLEWFNEQSGLLINYDKTVLYRIGSIADAEAKLYTQKQLAWVDEGGQHSRSLRLSK